MAKINDILADLKTTLEGIDGTGDFTSTVNKVERFGKVWDEVELLERIFIGIQKARTRNRHLPGGVIHPTTRIILTCYIGDSEKTTRDTAIDDLLKDIQIAIGADVTLGGTCIECQVTEWEDDEGDPEQIDNCLGTLEVILEAMYEDTLGIC